MTASTPALFRVPLLTTGRVRWAYAIAIAADAAQFLLGPLGWVGTDQAIDLLAMGLTWWMLGFHVLLLPTFVLEFLPVAGILPTWTGCVAAVIALRRHRQAPPPPSSD